MRPKMKGIPMLTKRMGYAAVLGLIALVSTACNNGSETDTSYKAAITTVSRLIPFASGPNPRSSPSRQPRRTTLRLRDTTH